MPEIQNPVKTHIVTLSGLRVSSPSDHSKSHADKVASEARAQQEPVTAKALHSPDEKFNRTIGARFEDLMALRDVGYRSPGRAGDMLDGDMGFQTEVQRLVTDKKIRPGSFVLSDTGHDIPVLSQLTSNPGLRVQGALNLRASDVEFIPGGPTVVIGNQKRVLDQIQSFGRGIERAQQANAAVGEFMTPFLGLEAHRKKPIAESRLPTAEDLKAAGVKEVIYLKDASPAKKFDATSDPEDLKRYFEKLEKSGITVSRYGIDPRPESRLLLYGITPLRP